MFKINRSSASVALKNPINPSNINQSKKASTKQSMKGFNYQVTNLANNALHEHSAGPSRKAFKVDNTSRADFARVNTAKNMERFSPVVSELSCYFNKRNQENLGGTTVQPSLMTELPEIQYEGGKFRLVASSQEKNEIRMGKLEELSVVQQLDQRLTLMRTINEKRDRRLGLVQGTSQLVDGVKGAFSNSEKTSAIRTLLAEISAINLAGLTPEEKAQARQLFGELAKEIKHYINSKGMNAVKDKSALIAKVREIEEKQIDALELIDSITSVISKMANANKVHGKTSALKLEETIALKNDKLVTGESSKFSKKQVQEGFDLIIRALLTIKKESTEKELSEQRYVLASGNKVSFTIFADTVLDAMKAYTKIKKHQLNDTTSKLLQVAILEMSYFNQPAMIMRDNISLFDLISGSKLSGYFDNVLDSDSIITLKLEDGSRTQYPLSSFKENTVYNLLKNTFEKNYEEIKTVENRKEFFAQVLEEERQKFADYSEAASHCLGKLNAITTPYSHVIVQESEKVLAGLKQIATKFQAELDSKKQHKEPKQMGQLGDQVTHLYTRITNLYDVTRQFNFAMSDDSGFDLKKLNSTLLTAKFKDSHNAPLQFESQQQVKEFMSSVFSDKQLSDLIQCNHAISQMATTLEASIKKTLPALQNPDAQAFMKAAKHLNHSLPLEALFKGLAEEGLKTQAAKGVCLYMKPSFENSVKYVTFYNEAILDNLIIYGLLTDDQAMDYEDSLAGQVDDPIAGKQAKMGLLNATDNNINPDGVLIEIEEFVKKFSFLGEPKNADLIDHIRKDAAKHAKEMWEQLIS